MARPKYQVQPDDIPHALEYLLNALQDPDYPVKAPGRVDFLRYLEQLAGARTRDPESDARILNTWCETCLDSGQWQRLKASIRKRRYQATHDDNVQATLSKAAHDALLELQSLSQTDTLSAAILWAHRQLVTLPRV